MRARRLRIEVRVTAYNRLDLAADLREGRRVDALLQAVRLHDGSLRSVAADLGARIGRFVEADRRALEQVGDAGLTERHTVRAAEPDALDRRVVAAHLPGLAGTEVAVIEVPAAEVDMQVLGTRQILQDRSAYLAINLGHIERACGDLGGRLGRLAALQDVVRVERTRLGAVLDA